MRERLAAMPTWALLLSLTLTFWLPMLIIALFATSHLAVLGLVSLNTSITAVAESNFWAGPEPAACLHHRRRTG